MREVVHELTVLYDPDCPVCRRAATWLRNADLLVPVRLMPVASAAARESYPDLDHEACRKVITVIGDGGQVYRGEDAYIMCLWAAKRTRSQAVDFAAGLHPHRLRMLVDGTAFLRDLRPGAGCDEACGLPAPVRREAG